MLEFTHLPGLEINESMMDCPESETTSGDSSASEYEGASYTQEQLNQMELNNLVRDLALSKELSEVLASRLNEKKCQGQGTKITFYRYREQLLRYFTKGMIWFIATTSKSYFLKWEYLPTIHKSGIFFWTVQM